MLYFFLHGSLYLFSSHALTCDVNLWKTLCLSSHLSHPTNDPVGVEYRVRELCSKLDCGSHSPLILAWETAFSFKQDTNESCMQNPILMLAAFWYCLYVYEFNLQRKWIEARELKLAVELERFDRRHKASHTAVEKQTCNRWSTLNTMHYTWLWVDWRSCTVKSTNTSSYPNSWVTSRMTNITVVTYVTYAILINYLSQLK